MNFHKLLLLCSTSFASFIGIGAAALVNNLVEVDKPNNDLPFTTARNAMVIRNNDNFHHVNYFGSTYDEDGQVKYGEKDLAAKTGTGDGMGQGIIGYCNTQHTIEFNFSINNIYQGGLVISHQGYLVSSQYIYQSEDHFYLYIGNGYLPSGTAPIGQEKVGYSGDGDDFNFHSELDINEHSIVYCGQVLGTF